MVTDFSFIPQSNLLPQRNKIRLVHILFYGTYVIQVSNIEGVVVEMAVVFKARYSGRQI